MGGYKDNSDDMQTVTSLSFSFPLGGNGPRVPSLSNSWTHSTDGSSQLQSSLTGMLDEAQTTNYSLNVMRDQQYKQTTLSGNMQKRFSQTTVGLNASKGGITGRRPETYKARWPSMAAASLSDLIWVKRSPLVEAKGAEGAKVYNSSQLEINDSGYALVPAVTPYRYNRISLDPQGMDGDAELVDSEKQVAPVAGAAVKVVFRTRPGKALLIKSRMADGSNCQWEPMCWMRIIRSSV